MKRIFIYLLACLCCLNFSLAYANGGIPDEVIVREHWISLTKSYDIETKSQKLGTLYRRFISFLPTYDFYDTQNIKTVSAHARFFSLGVHLDVYDQRNIFIGEVEEKVFNFFPTFEIIARDSVTKLARAEMNFWGTKFYIYDPNTEQEMAVMSRSFFRLKNDWTIRVTNRPLLEQKNIDPHMLVTVLAVQAEIEEWNQEKNDDDTFRAKKTLQLAGLRIKNKLEQLAPPSHQYLERLADELDQGFKSAYPSYSNQSNEAQVTAFVDYCFDLINAADQTDARKKAILSLLELRLHGHQA